MITDELLLQNGKSLQEIDKRMEEIDKLVKEADEFENVDFESFEYRTEKENVIYEKTKEFGRTQFVREISFQISENKKLRDRELIITMELDKLQKENEQLKEERETNINFISELQNDLYKITMKNQELTAKIDKDIELNNQIIKDIKGFYRPTSDTIYSGDCLIDIAEQNLKVLKDSDVDECK